MSDRPKRFVVYARKSPGESKGAGIPAQIDWGVRRGQEKGYVPAEDLGMWLKDGEDAAPAAGVYVEEGSHGAALRSRAALFKMLVDAKAHRFDALVVYRSDRLSRSEETGVYIAKALRQFGTEVLAGDNPDGSDLVGMFTRVLAAHEVHVIRSRTKDALAKVRQDKFLGRRVLGFTDVDRHWIPRPEAEALWAMAAGGTRAELILETPEAKTLKISSAWSLKCLLRNVKAFHEGRLDEILEKQRTAQRERLERMWRREEREERALIHRLIDLVPDLRQ